MFCVWDWAANAKFLRSFQMWGAVPPRRMFRPAIRRLLSKTAFTFLILNLLLNKGDLESTHTHFVRNLFDRNEIWFCKSMFILFPTEGVSEAWWSNFSAIYQGTDKVFLQRIVKFGRC